MDKDKTAGVLVDSCKHSVVKASAACGLCGMTFTLEATAKIAPCSTAAGEQGVSAEERTPASGTVWYWSDGVIERRKYSAWLMYSCLQRDGIAGSRCRMVTLHTTTWP